MGNWKKSTVGLAILFTTLASQGVNAETFDYGRSPDASINNGVSTEKIDRDVRLWMEQSFIADKLDRGPSATQLFIDKYYGDGSVNELSIGQWAEINGCTDGADCSISSEIEDSTIGGEINKSRRDDKSRKEKATELGDFSPVR